MKPSAFLFIQLLLYLVTFIGTDQALAKTKAGHKPIKKTYTQQKPRIPDDIWDKIKAGMQIPQPTLVDMTIPVDQITGEGFSLQNNPPSKLDCYPPNPEKKPATHKNRLVEPAQLVAPNPKYTELGLKKLHPEVNADIAEPPEAKYTELGMKKLHPGTLRKKAHYCSMGQNAWNNPACKSQANSFSSEWSEMPSDQSVDPVQRTQFSQETELPCQKPVQNSQMEEQQLQLIAKQQKQNAIYSRVQLNILRYTQRPEYLQQVVNNARPYLYFIVENLKTFKLPYELALIPIIESGYQPTVFSVKNAAGLWQFIPSTGLDFNLRQSDRYDDRLDIEASTKAAMRYFTYLKQHYNDDWLLALAAYNCGLGVVDAAIKDNSMKGLETDYWSLELPNETQEYVPRLLALAAIFANPTQYQFKPKRINDEPYFIKTRIDKKTDISYLMNKDLKTVAQLADLDYYQLVILNPGFINAKIRATAPFNLFMPEINAQRLHQRLEAIAKIIVKTEKDVQPYSIKTQSTQTSDIPPYAFPYFTLDVQ